MRIAIILNGISLAKDRFYKKILPHLKNQFHTDVFETQSKNDAVCLAEKAVAKKYDIICAAGGDGTQNQVLNGMVREYAAPSKLPMLAIIPLGSGNDFARSLGLDDDATKLISAIQDLRTKMIDIGEVEYAVSPVENGVSSIREKRFFLNVVDVGMGPEVVRKVLGSGRALGSAFAYYQSILSTFFSYKPVVLHAASSNWTWHNMVRTFAVANGRFYGNGLCIAPEAKLDDNQLDIFACGGVSVMDFILQSIPLKAGKKINHSKVSYGRTQEIILKADEPLEVEADGEILGWLPATVRLSDIKVSILMG